MDFCTFLLFAFSCLCMMTGPALPSPTGLSIVVPDDHRAVAPTASISGYRRMRESTAEISQSVTNDSDKKHKPNFKVVRHRNGTLGVVVLNPKPTWTQSSDETSDLLASPASSADISFPNDTESRPSFVPPRCNNGQTFCEDVPDYPLELIEAVLSREGHRFSELFGRDILNEEPSLANRFSGINESTMCESMRQVIYPKTGMTKENDWLYIVNSDKFQQGVLVEQCTKRDEACNYTKSFPRGYQTRCKQMYIYRQLVSVNGDGITEKNMFQIPSCCQCVVTEA